jgi:hypothetical protein
MSETETTYPALLIEVPHQRAPRVYVVDDLAELRELAVMAADDHEDYASEIGWDGTESPDEAQCLDMLGYDQYHAELVPLGELRAWLVHRKKSPIRLHQHHATLRAVENTLNVILAHDLLMLHFWSPSDVAELLGWEYDADEHSIIKPGWYADFEDQCERYPDAQSGLDAAEEFAAGHDWYDTTSVTVHVWRRGIDASDGSPEKVHEESHEVAVPYEESDR